MILAAAVNIAPYFWIVVAWLIGEWLFDLAYEHEAKKTYMDFSAHFRRNLKMAEDFDLSRRPPPPKGSGQPCPLYPRSRPHSANCSMCRGTQYIGTNDSKPLSPPPPPAKPQPPTITRIKEMK